MEVRVAEQAMDQVQLLGASMVARVAPKAPMGIVEEEELAAHLESAAAREVSVVVAVATVDPPVVLEAVVARVARLGAMVVSAAVAARELGQAETVVLGQATVIATGSMAAEVWARAGPCLSSREQP